MPETLLQPNASHELDSQATLSNDTDFLAESYFSSDEIDPNLDLFGDPKENASSSPAAPQSYSHDTTSNAVSYALPFPGLANESNGSIEVATHSKSRKRTRSPSPLPQAATTGIVRDHPRKKQKTNNNPRSGSKTKHVPPYIFNAPPPEMQHATMAVAPGAANWQNLFRRTLSSSENRNSQSQHTQTLTKRLELDKSPFNSTGVSPIDLVSPSPSPSPPSHSQIYSNINYFDELPETFPKPYTFTATNIPSHIFHPSPLTHTTAIPTTTNHISTSHQQPQVPSQYTTQITLSSPQAQHPPAIPNYGFTEDENFCSGPSLDVNQEPNQSLTVNPQQLTRQTQNMLSVSPYLESHIPPQGQGQSTFLPDVLDPALLQLIQNQHPPPQPQPQSLMTIPPPTNNTYPRFENSPGNPTSSNHCEMTHYESNPYALTQYTNTNNHNFGSMPSVTDQLTNHNHNQQQIELASTIARQSQLENFANQISIFDKTALFNLFLNDPRFQQRLQLQIHKHCQQQLQLETGNWREANGLLVGRVMALEERYNRQRLVNTTENDTSLINV